MSRPLDRPRGAWPRRARTRRPRLEHLEPNDAPVTLLDLSGLSLAVAGGLAAWQQTVRAQAGRPAAMNHVAPAATTAAQVYRTSPTGSTSGPSATSSTAAGRSSLGEVLGRTLPAPPTVNAPPRLNPPRATGSVSGSAPGQPGAIAPTAPLSKAPATPATSAAPRTGSPPSVVVGPAAAKPAPAGSSRTPPAAAPAAAGSNRPAKPAANPGRAAPAKLPVDKGGKPAAPLPRGTLQAAGPDTELIVPYQKQAASPTSTFTGQFVVQLKPGVEPTRAAAKFGATQQLVYDPATNLNLWQFGPDVTATSVSKGLARDKDVVDAYPVYAEVMVGNSPQLFNDPLLSQQWHLYNQAQGGGDIGFDGRVQPAWDLGVTGKGVTIGVVDSGSDYTNPDLGQVGLAANQDGGNYRALASFDFIGNDDDAAPTSDQGHGTSVAGVAAAIGNNGEGGSGVAPGARFGAIRLIAGVGFSDDTNAQALAYNTLKPGQYDASTIDIFNNSWGRSNEGSVSGPGPLTQSALDEGAYNGRGGLGTIYVWSAGNGRRVNPDVSANANYGGFANNRNGIAVAAVGDVGVVASYSAPGANLFISAPSNGNYDGITTTDITGSGGYSGTNYNDTFGGTSSAAPYISGVIALLLEANPNLTVRDVKHILAQSATKIDPTNPSWTVNAANVPFSTDYGFGMVNAAGAVQLASNWQPVGPELLYSSGRLTPTTTAIPGDGGAISHSFNVPAGGNLKTETVEVVFDATHARRGDLEITLTSPSGVTSVLAQKRTNDTSGGSPGADFADGTQNADYKNWIFTTNRDWGEDSQGTWTLTVRDLSNGVSGTWNGWHLRIYGTEAVADTVGPRVTSLTTNNGVLNGGSVASFQVQFNEPIDPATFGTADVSVQRVGGPAIAVSGVTPVAGTGNRAFDITFPSQSTVGDYRVDVGIDLANPIEDAAGNALNQNADTVNGQGTADTYTEFVRLADQFLFSFVWKTSSTYGAGYGDGFTFTFDPLAGPTAAVTDLNVFLKFNDVFARSNFTFRLAAPGVAAVTLIARAAGDTTNGNNPVNGYRDTVLDDQATNVLPTTTTGVRHYTDSYQPSNPLSAFNGAHAAGDWDFSFVDQPGIGTGGVVFDYGFTASYAIPDIALDSVTNTDADRDMVEVTYTIANADASPFSFGVYGSSNPFFDANADTLVSTISITNPADLAPGTHTIEVASSQFPDPDFTRNREFYSLVVADPQHLVTDYNRFNNYALLSGVTATPTNNLYIAANPFGADAITVADGSVSFNGTPITYNNAAVGRIFVNTGGGADVVSAAGTNHDILAFLGAGDDSYSGGNQVDTVQGGAGNDTLAGNLGNDRLYGMIGTDSVDGGEGADTVSVGPGGVRNLTQTLTGGPGNDLLLIDGTSANDRIQVWDPDGNDGVVGSTLRASVSSPAGLAPVTGQIGEPDGFGYLASTTAFQNIDLVPGAPGVTTLINGSDDSAASINLGANTFNFYGVTYTGLNQLFASSNGLITFGSGLGTPNNGDLTTSPTQAAIAAFWDDLLTGATSGGAGDDSVLYQIVGNRLIIEWSNVVESGISGEGTFQAILQLNTGSTPGTITLNYSDVAFGDTRVDNGADATVGIKTAGTSGFPANGNSLLLSYGEKFSTGRDPSGPGTASVKSGSAIQIAYTVGVVPATIQEITINSVDAGDIVLVNASYGDDFIQLSNPAIDNSTVGLASQLIGGPGSDTFFGGHGPDRLFGDSGFTALPGDGVDVFHTADGVGNDFIIATSGVDNSSDTDIGDTIVFTT